MPLRRASGAGPGHAVACRLVAGRASSIEPSGETPTGGYAITVRPSADATVAASMPRAPARLGAMNQVPERSAVPGEPMGALPGTMRREMARIGPIWGSDIQKHRDIVLAAYAPLLAQAP